MILTTNIDEKLNKFRGKCFESFSKDYPILSELFVKDFLDRYYKSFQIFEEIDMSLWWDTKEKFEKYVTEIDINESDNE